MYKRILALILSVVTVFAVGLTGVSAGSGEDVRVCIGNDLTQNQRAEMYDHFGVEEGSVTELTVSIDEERAILGDFVPASKIGKKSISSVYIKVLSDGGIKVNTHNINWCTSQMYIAALATAGITDAEIMVAAPFEVSGTAALAGIYKSYEDVTGDLLSDVAKQVAASELVTTGELAETLGSMDAVALINELKVNLEKTKSMTDEELDSYIVETAKYLEVELTAEQIVQIRGFIRQLAEMDIDTNEWADRLNSIAGSLQNVSNVTEGVSGFFSSVQQFFQNIVDWFANLFS